MQTPSTPSVLRGVQRIAVAVAITLALAPGLSFAEDKLPAAKVEELIDKMEAIRQTGTDVTRHALIVETYKSQKIAKQAVVYERGEDFVMLFTEPRSDRGSGMLRLGRNIWTYNSGAGTWDRSTERDRLAGTNTRRSDLGVYRLKDLYTAEDNGEAMLGKVNTRVLTLRARPEADVAFPLMKLWVNQEFQEVKREEYADSGKLMRTSYITTPVRLTSPDGSKEYVFPGEVRIFDAVEEGRVTVIRFKGYSMGEIKENVFTKVWLEKHGSAN